MIMRRRRSRRPLGLTIIELMTVLVVLGVLITLVAPTFRGMMQRQRVQGIQDQLITDLQLARSELAARASASASSPVAVTFGGDGLVTCYTIHTGGTGATCDCTRAVGQVCQPPNILQEVKTVQLPRASGITLAASSPSSTSVAFSPPQGLATPAGLTINITGDISGQVRTTVGELGRPVVCSPDGSIRGVPPC